MNKDRAHTAHDMGWTDTESKEVVRVEVVEIVKGKVELSVRLRGEHNWLFFDHMVVPEGGAVTISDGAVEAYAPEGMCAYSLPMSAFDETVKKYG